jgi:hypothetical protein
MLTQHGSCRKTVNRDGRSVWTYFCLRVILIASRKTTCSELKSQTRVKCCLRIWQISNLCKAHVLGAQQPLNIIIGLVTGIFKFNCWSAIIKSCARRQVQQISFIIHKLFSLMPYFKPGLNHRHIHKDQSTLQTHADLNIQVSVWEMRRLHQQQLCYSLFFKTARAGLQQFCLPTNSEQAWNQNAKCTA